MNIKNLTEGMEIKNYKELCNILEIKVSDGNSKKKQLKDLERYCKFRKEGRKFIIEQIYEEEKAKIYPSVYMEFIGNILIDYLYKNLSNPGDRKILTIGKMIEIVGLANENYEIGNRHKKALSKALNVNLLSVYYFYNNTRGEFKRIIERALKSLHNRRILTFNKIKMICCKDGVYQVYRQATDQEESYITDIEKEVLNDMKYKSISEVFIKCKMKTFQKKVKNKLPEGWIYYFDAYSINVGTKAIKMEYENIKEQREELNKRSLKKVHKQLKTNENTVNENLLIENLIDIIKYDLDLADNIIIEQKRQNKEFSNKLNDKYYEICKINNEIEVIKNNKDNDEIESVDYYNYVKSIQLFEELELIELL